MSFLRKILHPDGESSAGGATDDKKADGATDTDAAAGGEKKSDIPNEFANFIGEGKRFKTAAEFVAHFDSQERSLGKLGTQLESLTKKLDATENERRKKDTDIQNKGANDAFKKLMGDNPIDALGIIIGRVLDSKLSGIIPEVQKTSILQNHLPSIKGLPGFDEFKDDIVALISENPSEFNSTDGVRKAYNLVVGNKIPDLLEKTKSSLRKEIEEELKAQGLAITLTGKKTQGKNDKDSKPETIADFTKKLATVLKESSGGDPLSKFNE